MNKSDKMKDAGEIAVKMYKRCGINHALNYILTFFEDIAPVHSAFCSVRNSETMSISVLSFLGAFAENYKFSPIYYDGSLAAKDDLNDNITSNSSKNELFNPLYFGTPPEHSFIRVRLFQENEYVFFIGFWSNLKDVFLEKNIVDLKILTEPLAKALHDDYLLDNQVLSPLVFYDALSKIQMLENCTGLEETLEQVKNIAHTNITVLLTGETGTGKNLLAKMIFELSNRKNNAYVYVNCGSLPDNLIESELFGYEKGAFTGAFTQKAGYFEEANNGTIFLDEIGELSLHAQTRLLHILDSQEIIRVGGTRVKSLNIRVVAATNKDLREMVKNGKFREDLFYRINIYPIYIPPLRNRKQDIVPLVKNLMMDRARKLGINNTDKIKINPEQYERLFVYDWPGNVRELEHIIERYIIDSLNKKTNQKLEFRFDEIILSKNIVEKKSHSSFLSLEESLNSHIIEVMKQCDNRIYGKKGAAVILKIHPNTLRGRLIKMGYDANILNQKCN